MDIADIRKENMLALIDGFKTQAEFAHLVGTKPAYISQLKKGGKKTGERVMMGDTLARGIETALNLPYGWMDKQHSTTIHNQFNNSGYVGGSVSQSVMNTYANSSANDDDWIQITDQALAPTFVRDDWVRIDRGREAQAGSYVLAECEGKQIVRKYRPPRFDDNGTAYQQLVVYNDDYPIIDSRHQAFAVLGVVVELKRKLVQ